MNAVYNVTMPQWTHADFSPHEQASLIAAKMRLQYAGHARAAALEAAKDAGLDAAATAKAVANARPTIQPGQPQIAMYTGDVYEVVDNGDERWAARLVVAASPPGLPVVWNGVRTTTPEVGTVFVAHHGAEHEPLPEISTQNIRVECGVVKAEGRLDGHDEELKALRAEVKALRADCANLRGEVKGLRFGTTMLHAGPNAAEIVGEDPSVTRGRMLETS